MRRRLLILVLVLGAFVGATGVARAEDEGGGTARDLEIRGHNPDGTLTCGKWCGVIGDNCC